MYMAYKVPVVTLSTQWVALGTSPVVCNRHHHSVCSIFLSSPEENLCPSVLRIEASASLPHGTPPSPLKMRLHADGHHLCAGVTLGSKITSCDGGPCELCGHNQKLYPLSHRGRGIVLGFQAHGQGAQLQNHGLASQLLCSLALAVEWVWLHRRQWSRVGKPRPVLC